MTDGGVPAGVANADETMLRISNMVRDSIKPDVTMFVRYEKIDAGGKDIIAVTIQRGVDRPYYLASKGCARAEYTSVAEPLRTRRQTLQSAG